MASFVGGVLRILRDERGRGGHGRNLGKDPHAGITAVRALANGKGRSLASQSRWFTRAHGRSIRSATLRTCSSRQRQEAMASEARWSRLYWHTQQGNAPARRLYDKFAVADDFIRYRLTLT